MELALQRSIFKWQVSESPYSSPFIEKSMTFGQINPVFLLDQYSGKRPALLNREFLQTGALEFKILASAMLDSNLASQVHAVANGGTTKDGFLALLRFLILKRWDISLYFYYLEHYCKSPKADFFPNAISRTRALLSIQTMNEEQFLHKGQIISNPNVVAHYLEGYAANSLDEVAEKRVREFCETSNRHDFLEHIEAIEIALTKMVLLRRFEMVGAKPIAQFEAFLDQDLDARLAREALLALHYFHDRAGRLLGIQPNTNKMRASAMLRSTAWDMYLIRLPEQFFSGSPTELCLSFIATQEKQLYQLTRLFFVESLIGYANGSVLPVIGYNATELPAEAASYQPPLRNPRAGKRAAPAGMRDALFAELLRRLPE
jgi:hypothetical protein